MMTTMFSTSSKGTSDRPPPCGSGVAARTPGAAGSAAVRPAREPDGVAGYSRFPRSSPARGEGGGSCIPRRRLDDGLAGARGRQPRVRQHRVRQPGLGTTGPGRAGLCSRAILGGSSADGHGAAGGDGREGGGSPSGSRTLRISTGGAARRRQPETLDSALARAAPEQVGEAALRGRLGRRRRWLPGIGAAAARLRWVNRRRLEQAGEFAVAPRAG